MTDFTHLLCPNCHAKNRLPSEKITHDPKCGSCKNKLFQGAPLEIEQGLFDKYITGNDIPLLIDFWAPWCAPCKTFSPHFAAAAKSLEPKVRLLKVNTENAQQISARYGIQSIPSLLIFKNGKEQARVAGAMSTQQLIRWVNEQTELR